MQKKIWQEWECFVPALKQGQHNALLQRIAQLRKTGKTIYPSQENIFSALYYCYPSDIKVIILGQDPYHQPNQAHGLAFSVAQNVAAPPSLRNIFKEINSDIYNNTKQFDLKCRANLDYLAKQGVLLLNTILSVEDSKPLAHYKLGWQDITQSILQSLAESSNVLSILLWGKHAQCYADIFHSKQHLVHFAPHPSPLSARRGFLGCKHFSSTNKWLVAHKLQPINW